MTVFMFYAYVIIEDGCLCIPKLIERDLISKLPRKQNIICIIKCVVIVSTLLLHFTLNLLLNWKSLT